MIKHLSRFICYAFLLAGAGVAAGCAGGDSDRLPQAPGLELSLTAGSPGDKGVAANATEVVSHIHLEATGTQAVSISSVTLSASGTGNDLVDISSVEVYLDFNDNDAYNPGVDVLIGSGAFDSDDGKALITLGSTQIVSPGAGRNWLVRCVLNGNGPDGATYSLSIADTSDVDVKFISGVLTWATGLPLTGAVLTITSGGAKLNLLAGPAPPVDKSVLKGKTGVPMLLFTLYNRATGDVTVTSIRVTPTGSGHDALEISGAYMIIDSNGNGTSDAGDVFFASFGYVIDDNSIDVTGSHAIPAGAMAYFLVTYDFDSSAIAGSDFRASIAATNHIQPVVPTGTAPIQGALITIADRGTLSVQTGAYNPAGGSAPAGASNLPVLQLEFQAGTIEDVDISSLTIYATGTANDPAVFTQVRLYDDANGDGAVDAGDTELASGQFTADDGGIIYSAVGLSVAAGQTAHLLVTYDIAPSAPMGATFGAYIQSGAEIGSVGAISSLGIPASGSYPLSSGSFKIRTPDTFIGAAYLNTARFMHTQTTFTDPNDGEVRVLVCGGYDGTDILDTAEVYDPALDTWTELAAPMAKPRMLHSATLLADGQRIVIAGGTDGVMTTYQDGEIFDPATYTFTPVADRMTSRRQMHTAMLTNSGDIFYYGGQYIFGSLLYTDVTEYYNEPVNRFDPIGRTHYVRVLHTMNRLTGGTVIVTGGLGYAISGPKSTMLLKSMQLWATSPIINESFSWLQLAGFGRCGHVAVSLPDGELLIAGGYNLNLYLYTVPPFSGRKTAELINENSPMLGDENIRDVGEMSQVRFMPVAQLLPTGKVLIAGGTDDSPTAQALSTAELYDPAAKTFSDSSGAMVHARYRAKWSVIPGPDGQLDTSDDAVLITGGLVEYVPSPGPAQVTRFTEIYVP